MPRIEWLVRRLQGNRPAHHAAPGQGRVLGQRDQARAGARARGLPGVHAQAEHRRVVPRLRAPARERRRADLSAIRHAQCAHHRARRRGLRRRRQSLRVPAPARHGRGAVRQRGARALGQSFPAACTRRWARTKTCCPTWCERLLENGANTSFVNRIVDASLPAEEVVADPIAEVDALERVAHPRIPLPVNLFAPERAEFRRIQFRRWPGGGCAAARLRARLAAAVERGAGGIRPDAQRRHRAGAQSGRHRMNRSAAGGECGCGRRRCAPSPRRWRAQEDWDARRWRTARGGAGARGATCSRSTPPRFVARCVREAGKTLPDAIGEVREAVDFLRYYAARARRDFSHEVDAAGSHRRAQPAAPARQGRVRLHQSVEFSAGYLHGPGGRGARGRQHRGRQARRTDAADRGLCHRPAAAGGRAARCAALRAGRGRRSGRAR